MLDAYVIQSIKEEEARRRAAAEQGRRIHIDMPEDADDRSEDDTEDGQSGPVKIPLRDDEEEEDTGA